MNPLKAATLAGLLLYQPLHAADQAAVTDMLTYLQQKGFGKTIEACEGPSTVYYRIPRFTGGKNRSLGVVRYVVEPTSHRIEIFTMTKLDDGPYAVRGLFDIAPRESPLDGEIDKVWSQTMTRKEVWDTYREYQNNPCSFITEIEKQLKTPTEWDQSSMDNSVDSFADKQTK